MWLIVGLGNPGLQYRNNRHNIGFMAVDALHSHFAFAPWRKKFQGEISEGSLPGVADKLVLLKPQTFMNASGRAVQEAASFHKIANDHIVVFHDELDLEPGQVKVKQGGGAAGHNGLRSIDAHRGADYWRIRLGIGHPLRETNDDGTPTMRAAANKGDQVYSHVLSDFSKADMHWLEPLLEKLAQSLPLLLNKGAAEFLGALKADLRNR